MADEKKEEGIGYRITKTLIIGYSVICTISITNELIKYAQLHPPTPYAEDEKPITGTKVRVESDALVYSSLYDAINLSNGKTKYYDSNKERLIITSFYEVDGEYIRIDMKDNYKELEQQIIDKEGKLLAVITTVDLEKKTPEAFYNPNDLFIIKYTKNIVYKKKYR